MLSRVSCLLIITFFLILYIFTLAPEVLTADNAEFQLIATNLGVAHPPGFPLYTVLAHLATWLPFGDSPAYRINLFSAITSTITLFFVYWIVYRLTRSSWGAITAVIALGTATTFWAQATTANIRSLTALLAAMTIYWLIRFQEGVEEEKEKGKEKSISATSLHPRSSVPLLLASLSLSFGITHHLSLVFIAFVCGIFVLVVEPSLIRRPKRWLRPFLLSLLALLPLLYLPWRASVAAGRAPARLATWDGFWNHILARGFSGDFFYFIEPLEFWERLKVMGNVMVFQFHPLLLSGMVIGLLLMLRHNWKLALLFGGSFTIHTLITATYRAPQTVEYMLPAYVPAVICLGYGVGSLESREWRPEIRERKQAAAYRSLITVYSLLFLFTALHQGWQNYPSFATLHRNTSSRDYAQFLLDNAPADSTILAHWHWATTLWYLQEVEGQRPDVLTQFVFPTSEAYPATWARRVTEELAVGRDVLTTHYDAKFYANLPVPEPIGDGYLFRQEPRFSLPDTFTSLGLHLGNALTILGYRVTPEQVAIGQEATFTVAWQPDEAYCDVSDCQQRPITLFAHLVSPEDVLIAQEDLPITIGKQGILLTQFRLTPRLGALPDAYNLMVGAYMNTSEGIVPIGEPRTAIATLPVTSMDKRPFTHNPVRYPDAHNSRTLVGYDWDNTLASQPPRLYLHWQTDKGYITEARDVPEGMVTLSRSILGWEGLFTLHNQPTYYVPFAEGIVWTGPLLQTNQKLQPGDTIILSQTFHSQQPIWRDISTSVRLVGYEADSFTWSWQDLDDDFGVPAMGAIPTLKWIEGSTIYDPHQFTVPSTAVPGQRVGVLLNLYDTFTNRPIPVLDERFTPAQPWRESLITDQ